MLVGGCQGYWGASNIPSSLPYTTNLLSWHRADLGVTISTGVSAWTNQAGSYSTNANLSQSTGSKQPTYSATGGPNSRPVITFDGSNDIMQAGSISGTGPIFGFLVVTMPTFTANLRGLNMAANGSGADNNSFTSRATTKFVLGESGDDAAAQSVTAGTYAYYACYWNGGSSKMSKNGGSYVTGTVGSVYNPAGLTLGALATDSSWMNISYAELILYGAEVTGANLTAMNSYFNQVYGL